MLLRPVSRVHVDALPVLGDLRAHVDNEVIDSLGRFDYFVGEALGPDECDIGDERDQVECGLPVFDGCLGGRDDEVFDHADTNEDGFNAEQQCHYPVFY